MDKKWNLQDIKPASDRRKRPSSEPVRAEPVKRPPTIENKEDGTMHIKVANNGKKRRFGALSVVALLLLVVGGVFAISYLTRGAEVTVYPRHQQPNVNAEFTAHQTPQVGELAYEIMTLEADGERQVSATGQEEVTELATGLIRITKTTPEAQRLIKNTRFESPNGLIYRTTETVVVPGAVGGEPGSIQAEVFADQPGEEYNAPNGTFTVPGLQSDPALFEAITATVAEPITGGFSGQKFIIDETELATAKQALQMELRDALLERVPNEKPAGFVVFDEAVTITYESLPAVEYGDNLATIKEKATLRIPLFKDDEFATFIAAATIPGYEDRPVRVDDANAFTFSYTSATTTAANIANYESLEFKLVGRPLIVWTYDEGKLATDLLGTAKTALPTILGGYPAILRAEAVIRPFWKRSFPTQLDEITITEVVEAGDE